MRSRITYANVAATLALVLAIGTSGAVAGGLIGGKAVKNESLTGRDVRDGSLKPRDDRLQVTSVDALSGKCLPSEELIGGTFSSNSGGRQELRFRAGSSAPISADTWGVSGTAYIVPSDNESGHPDMFPTVAVSAACQDANGAVTFRPGPLVVP